MRHLLFAMVERVGPRAASALLMLVLAAFVTPDVVGLYVWPTLVLTLFLSLADGAIRQVALGLTGRPDGAVFLRRYRLLGGIGGALLIAGTVGVIVLVTEGELRSQALATLPLAAAPPLTVLTVEPLVRLQIRHRWSLLARLQLVASLASLVVSVPALILTRSLLGPTLQVVVAGLVFLLLVRRAEAREHDELVDSDESTEPDGRVPARSGPGHEFAHASALGLVGWVQGQADRVLIGLFSGLTVLGSFSFAVAIARNPGDAVSLATGNVLRATLLGPRARAETKWTDADRTLSKAVLAAAVFSILLIVGAWALGPVFLSDDWTTAVRVAMIIALSIPITVVSWSAPTFLLAQGDLRFAAPVKLIGVVLALPVALLAAVDLQAAAWLYVAREALVAVVFLVLQRRHLPGRSLRSLIAVTACAGLLLTLLP